MQSIDFFIEVFIKSKLHLLNRKCFLKLFDLLHPFEQHLIPHKKDPSKVGISKNADQEKEVATSLSLHFWCSLLYFQILIFWIKWLF